jgi:drug/metabolite transporter (DMT)-like permease
MFLGEIGCLILFLLLKVYRATKRRNLQEQGVPISEDYYLDAPPFRTLIFCIPATLDLLSTCVSYIGLTLTYASSYQMLRGSAIIFTALLTKFFLGKSIAYQRWLGILIIIAGLALVGITDLMFANPNISYLRGTIENSSADGVLYELQDEPNNDHNFSNVLLGDLLIIASQILVAIQLVYEEKFIKKYDVPVLQALGLEGLFGFSIMSALLIPMYFLNVGERFGKNPRHALEDPLDAFCQLKNNSPIL